jgi:hypothetical protein
MTGTEFQLLDAAPMPAKELTARIGRAMGGLPYWSTAGLQATQPIALATDTYAALGRVGSQILALLHQVAIRLGTRAVDRHRALGMDPRLEPLFVSQTFEERYATAIARPDVLITATGPKFIEFNVGAGVGAMVHVHTLNRMWSRCYGPGAPFLAADPLAARARLLRRMCDEVAGARRVIVLARPADIGATSARYYLTEVADLRRHGMEARLCDPADLPAVLGRGKTGGGVLLRRYVPQEWADRGADLTPLAAERHPGWWPALPYSSYLLSNKTLLAYLSQRPAWLSTADADLVDRYVPWTRPVRRGDVSWRGETADLLKMLIKHQEHFVLKHATGNSGRGVHLGAETEDRHWAALVSRAGQEGSWVAQELVDAVRAPMRVADPGTGRGGEVRASVVISPYLIDGLLAGCQARYSTGTSKVLNASRPGTRISVVVGG